jgi:hypothetical protein
MKYRGQEYLPREASLSRRGIRIQRPGDGKWWFYRWAKWVVEIVDCVHIVTGTCGPAGLGAGVDLVEHGGATVDVD